MYGDQDDETFMADTLKAIRDGKIVMSAIEREHGAIKNLKGHPVSDLVKEYGPPAKKGSESGIEVWVYHKRCPHIDLGTVTITTLFWIDAQTRYITGGKVIEDYY